MSRTLFTLLAIAAAVPVSSRGEDLYVRPNHTSGANTGADWANAWNGFASIVWGEGPGKLGAGDTCWIAGGAYTAPLLILGDGAPGRPLVLQRVRATDSAPAAAPGWDAAFDQPVVITGAPREAVVSFDGGHGSFVTLDGRTPAGIRVLFGNGGRGVEIESLVDLTDITLRCIEAAGPGPIVQIGNTRGFDLTIPAMLTNLTLSRCSAHHADTLLQVTASTNLLIEHCDFHHSGALNAATYHPNAIYLGPVRNLVFRYNRLHDYDVEGLFFGHAGNRGARIHGNLFYQGASPPDTGRGIEFDDTADSADFLVYHNTFVDLPLPGVNFRNGQPHPGAIVMNNLFVGCSAEFGPAAHDYNLLPVAAGEAHGLVGGGPALFIDAARFDYHLAASPGPITPRNTGVALGPPFDLDPDGRPRGADGGWDIGAFEFVNRPPTLTPPANFTMLAGTESGPLAFTVGDPDSAAATLVVTAASDNPALLPAARLTFAGTDASRSLQLSPVPGQTGAATIALTVDDGMGLTRSAVFTVTVLGSGLTGQTVTQGREVSFSAPAGLADGTLHWQVSNDGGATFTDLADGSGVSGVRTRVLTLANVTTALHGSRYRYVLHGAAPGTSAAALLTVNPAFFSHPAGILRLADGRLLVSDAATNTVRQIADGAVSLIAGRDTEPGATDGVGATARFNQPAGLAGLADGAIALADSANATIRRLSTTGFVTTLAGAPGSRGANDGLGRAATFNAPVALAVDASGNLLVADSLNHAIRRVAPGGSVTTLAGGADAAGTADGRGAEARFNFPTGLAIDAAGDCLVADTINNTLRRVTAAGVVTTLAGVPGVSGATDGTGGAALFNRPSGLVFAPDGNFYLADTGNSVVRRVTPQGAVQTIAGLPGIAGLKDGTGVVDDGRGLAPPAAGGARAGSGLHIMRYRAEAIGGSLEIAPNLPQGVKVVCKVSLAAFGAPGGH